MRKSGVRPSSRLSDETVLADIAANDKYRYVRDAAEHRIDELKTDLWDERSKSAPASQGES